AELRGRQGRGRCGAHRTTGRYGRPVAFPADPLYRRFRTTSGEAPLSVTQQQVLDALSKVMSPRGVALPAANVLSAISAGDGTVFFSINVDAAEARAWENVREQAEA